MRLTLFALSFAVSGASGCTAIVLLDAASDDAVPCDRAADCPAGSRCADGACAAVDDDADPPPAPNALGKDGGTLTGPDGVAVDIPADALARTVTFTVKRASATTIAESADGVVTAHSRAYTVEPAVDLEVAASVELPLLDPCTACEVFRAGADDDLWLALGGTVAGGTISASTTTLGTFIAGVVENAP